MAIVTVFSVKYNIWTERFGSGPKSAYCEVRPFSCEGGPDKVRPPHSSGQKN